ncbi:MAG TPA: response regulator [Pyrinomonadaceae bacterium]|jgi:chemosensory pili system protein ChpA (sensor histidine kinase/response regulator)
MSKTILIVEDHEDFRQILSGILAEFGYRVREATNGHEALRSVQQSVPDMVLMDLSMPKMDGVTAARRIRNLPETQAMPLICMTTYGEPFRQAALEAGFNELLPKPFDIDLLIKIINRFING